MEPQQQQPRRSAWMFLIGLSITIVLTLGLAGVIIWLVVTQNLMQLSVIVGLIASVVAIVTAPLIFYFTVFHKPELQEPPAPSQQKETEPSQTPSPGTLWNVPYHRNPYFTGRELLLEELHDRLTTNKAAALMQPQAISGLGGIGKTQTAVEYAYRYRHEYRYVLWARAASRETLVSDLMIIAELLKLPERRELDQQKVVGALNRWLSQNTDWLLILDNADDLELVRDMLPIVNSGHILLTTRAHSVGSLAHRVVVQEMDLEEGTHLLLRRAGILTEEKTIEQIPGKVRAQAEAIVKEMAGLPLALEQAGAYLEETDFGISGYLNLYRRYRTDLLNHKSKFSPQYPYTVATTWSLAFQRVEEANPAAADLLRLCAFLHADAIPESLITDAASALSTRLKPVVANPIKWNEAIQVLLSYSLVRRNPATQTLSIHRLVQAVLRDAMEPKIQRQWAERAILLHKPRLQRIYKQLYEINMQLMPPGDLHSIERGIVVQFITDFEQSVNDLLVVIKGINAISSSLDVSQYLQPGSIGQAIEKIRSYALVELYSSLHFYDEGDIAEYFRCLLRSSDYLEEALKELMI